jgi:fructose-1-phosphate kinase PfkB-like protein
MHFLVMMDMSEVMFVTRHHTFSFLHSKRSKFLSTVRAGKLFIAVMVAGLWKFD